MQAKQILLTCAFFALALSACSAKVSSSDGGGPTVQPFSNVVPGPSLDGHWKSGCVSDRWDSDFIVYDMQIAGQAVVRKEQHYSDPQCMTPTTQLERDGLFRYISKSAAGFFEVEYRFKMSNGTYTTGENLGLNLNVLSITDRVTGELAVPNINLQKE